MRNYELNKKIQTKFIYNLDYFKNTKRPYVQKLNKTELSILEEEEEEEEKKKKVSSNDI